MFCKTTCEIFLSIKDASNKYKIGSSSIRNQCKGNSYKKEKFYNEDLKEYMEFQYYDVDIHSRKRTKKIPVICVTTKQKFYSIAEASRFFNINQNTLNSALRRGKKIKSSELEFMYLYDYTCKNYGKMASFNNKSSETIDFKGIKN